MNALLRTACVVAFAAAASGCAPVPRAEIPPPSLAEWQRARARLAALALALAPEKPRTVHVTLAIDEPVSHRRFSARGAVALAPPGALRMILLGPGGTTALDFWSKDEQFRFAIPAIGSAKRGDGSTPRSELRGLPVDFLRFWLLHPTRGNLLTYTREARADRFILRDGDAIVDLEVRDDGGIVANRVTWSRPSSEEPPRILNDERVIADRAGCANVLYEERASGLRVAIRCERVETERDPDGRAFRDPDGDRG